MNQKDAVFETIKSLKPSEVDKDDPVVLTKQEKKVVEARLFDGFRRGKIQYNNELPSDDKLAMYVSGLVSNWLRKDTRLNGHRRYTPQRPGSRGGFVPPPAQTVVLPSEDLEAIKAFTAAGDEVTVFVVRRKSENDEEQHVH